MIEQRSPLTVKQWYSLALIGLLVATLVRVTALDAQSFTFDEADRVVLARLPLGESLIATSREGLHVAPLLHLILRPFVYPLNEAWARLPSALLGVLSVALMAALAKHWLGQNAGLLALWLMALNPFHVWFSRMATMYSLMLVGVCGSMWVFGLLLRRNRPRYWLALGFFTFVGTFTHHFALAVPLIQMLYLLANFKRYQRLFRVWVLTQAVAILPLALWLLWGISTLDVFYIGTAGLRPASPLDLFQTVWNFGLGYTGESNGLIVAALTLIIGTVMWGLISAWRRVPAIRLWLIWFCVPLLVAFSLSFRLPMYVDRYLSPALPAFVLLLVLGVTHVPSRVRLGAILGLLAISVFAVGRIYFDRNFYVKENWRGASRYIVENEQPGDVVLNTRQEWLLPMFLYYTGQAPLYGIAALHAVTPVADLTSDARRVWLVWPHAQDLTHLLARCSPLNLLAEAVSVDLLNWMKQHAAQMMDRSEWECITVFRYDLN